MPDARFRQRLGTEIRAARNRQGLTQAALADRLGLRRTSVTNIEAGDQGLPLETFLDLAAALGTTPQDLLGRAVVPDTSPSAARLESLKPLAGVDAQVERWTGTLISKGLAGSRQRANGRT